MTDAGEAFALIERAVLRFAPGALVEEKAGTLRYSRPGDPPFLVVKRLARRVDVGFTRIGRARSPRIYAARGRLPFARFLVEVEAPGDVDSELLAWMRESYELGE